MMSNEATESPASTSNSDKSAEVKSKFASWSANRWHHTYADRDLVQVSANGLAITKILDKDRCTNVRAKQPISRAMLAAAFASVPGSTELVYWEVHVTRIPSAIGWVGNNFPLNSSDHIGVWPDSFAIDCHGNYWQSGQEYMPYGKGRVDGGDVLVLGTGITREGAIFFTKDGQLNGRPIIVLKEDSELQDLLLYPALTLYWRDTVVEDTNFGADPGQKPFRFDIDANRALLFNS